MIFLLILIFKKINFENDISDKELNEILKKNNEVSQKEIEEKILPLLQESEFKIISKKMYLFINYKKLKKNIQVTIYLLL